MKLVICRSITFLLIYLGFFLEQAFSLESTALKLQWVDSTSSIVDLDWPAQLKWVWSKTDVKAQWWVELPPLLRLKPSEDSSTHFFENDERTLLIFETKSPKLIEKFEISDGREEDDPNKVSTADNQAGGLVLTVEFSKPTLLIHDSCKTAGVLIKEIQSGIPFFFLSMYCKKGKNGEILAYIRTSEDAEILNLNQEVQKEPFPVYVKAETQCIQIRKFQAAPFHFELSLKKAELKKPERTKIEAPMPVKDFAHLTLPEWTVRWGIQTSYMTYSSGIENSLLDPSAYNLQFRAKVVRSLIERRLDLEVEMNLPILTLLPKSKFFAYGLYEFNMRLRNMVFEMNDKTKVFVSPGLATAGVYLDTRPDVQHILLGTQLLTGLSYPNFEVDLGVTSFFSGNFNVAGSFSYFLENFRRNENWGLMIRMEYFKIYSTMDIPIYLSQVLFGFTLGY